MVKKKKAQAAFEYLTTYGWAVLTALVAIGALAYFGFLNPSNLLPNRCDFGSQLECAEYRISASNGRVDLMLRNNFGKDIELTDVEAIENTVLGNPFAAPLQIPSGSTVEAQIPINYIKPAGEKQEIDLIITFKRDGVGYREHNISGSVFVIVQ